jgi:transcriptional regulator with XRE-family HTH domain
MTSNLDADRIRQRRQELGITENQLGKMTGVSVSVISALERGTNHHTLQLAFLDRLAGELGWSVADLFPVPVTPPAARPPTADDAVLEALLLRYGRQTERSSVAHALGWTTTRLLEAERRLEVRLIGTGVRLHRHRGPSLQPDAGLATDARYQALLTAERGRLGISFSQARLLRQLLRGDITGQWVQHAGNADRVLLGELKNLGWCVPDGNGYRVSDAVEAAFAPARRALARTTLQRRKTTK